MDDFRINRLEDRPAAGAARATPAGDHDYERGDGGGSYAQHRQTDPRIAALVHAALGDARTVVNVGAGAGSYEPRDRHVVAIEPSEAMRRQRPADLAPAIDAVAERLPLDDAAVDAAMATLTLHQWTNPELGLRELRRVARRAVVVLTFDGTALGRFWLADYAPELIEAERRRYPSLESICATLGGARVRPVPIPIDCRDGFAEAYYGRPEAFLDTFVRSAQSAWSFVSGETVERTLARLAGDLASGPGTSATATSARSRRSTDRCG